MCRLSTYIHTYTGIGRGRSAKEGVCGGGTPSNGGSGGHAERRYIKAIKGRRSAGSASHDIQYRGSVEALQGPFLRRLWLSSIYT